MSNCEFCQIIRKEAPAAIIYEDEHTSAFLNIRPVRVGHTLVIPKVHCENIYTMDDEVFSHLMYTVKRCGNLIQNTFAAKNIEFIKSGWKVPHVHVHILPTYEPDEIIAKASLEGGVAYENFTELSRVAERIRKENSLL